MQKLEKRNMMSRSGKIIKVIYIILLLTLILVPVSQAKDKIVIGEVDPGSGVAIVGGTQYHYAIAQAVYEANQAGGVLGRQVELVWLDGMLKPEVATRNAEKLIQKYKADIIVGGLGSHVYMALSKLGEQYKKLIVDTGATSDDLTGKGFNRYFFRPTTCNTNFCYALAKYLSKLPYTKYYSIQQDYAFGRDMDKAFRDKMLKAKPSAKFVGEDFTPLGTKDFSPYLNKLQASGAEVVFMSHIGSDMPTLLKQAHELGLLKKIQFVVFTLDAATAELLGPAIEGVILAMNFSLTQDTPKTKAFIKRYHERNSHLESFYQYADQFPGSAYNAMKFLFAAIEKAGSLDPEAVIKAWEGMEFDYTYGKVKMRACDHQLLTPMSIFKVVKLPPKKQYYKNVKYYLSDPLMTIPAEECSIPLDRPDYNSRCMAEAKK